MTPRFLYQKWYLYLFLSAFLPCEGTTRGQGTTAAGEGPVGKSAVPKKAVDENAAGERPVRKRTVDNSPLGKSYRNLRMIQFYQIKTPRITGKRLSRYHEKLNKAFKGMMVTLNLEGMSIEETKWVKKNFKRKIKSNKDGEKYISAYHLLKKLLYSDGEGNVPIKDKKKWPPRLLIELDETIKDSLRSKDFKAIGQANFNTKEERTKYHKCLFLLIQPDYFKFYASPNRGEEDPKSHIRKETRDNWKELTNNPEKPQKPMQVNRSIETTQASSNGNALGKAFAGVVIALPVALWYQKHKQKTKKKSRKAKSMDY